VADLFHPESECVISDCGLFRYLIREVWEPTLPRVGWVLFNPSTATAERSDPTKSRIRNFTIAWGYGGFMLANQHAGGRSPNPGDLDAMADPTGPENDRWLEYLARAADLILVAWGDLPTSPEHTRHVVQILRASGKPLHCLGTAASGSPKHPLARGKAAIRTDQKPILWTPEALAP
jgi:hypothetical protein